MSFAEVMDIIGKLFVGAFVGAFVGFFILYFVAIIAQTIINYRANNISGSKELSPNTIEINIVDNKDFYTECIFILNTYKVSAFCQQFSDDIDKSIAIINTTSDEKMYIKHIANIVTYFNIFSYEHILDKRSEENISVFIKSKLAMVNTTARQKLNHIAEIYTQHLDETSILFATHYSMLTDDTKIAMLQKYIGKKHILPKLDL